MLVRFYVSHGTGPDINNIKERVARIADAMTAGLKNFGDEFETLHNAKFDKPHKDVDVACVWGIHGNSREIIKAYVAEGKRALFFDKALIRRLGNERQGHFRIGMDRSDSLKYMMREYRPFDRWESHRIKMLPKQEIQLTKYGRGAIVYAGSSQKYCDYHFLGDANDYAEGIFNETLKYAKKFRLTYRPKPSWDGYREIEGVHISTGKETLIEVLQKAFVLITHGSAASVESMIYGVPVISLGPSPAQPVSNLCISDILNPYFPPDQARYHWLCNLAYCQWTAEEFRTGEAWGFLKNELEMTQEKK